MIRAIIFDFYGVLVGQGFMATYKNAGGDIQKDKDFIKDQLEHLNYGKISGDNFHKNMSEKLNMTKNEWAENVEQSEKPNEKLLSYIKSLRGKYKTAILSNANYSSLTTRLNPYKLEDYFDHIIVSSEVGMTKPDPKIFQLAAEKLNVKINECIFVDDIKSYTDEASKLGMKTVTYINYDLMKQQIEAMIK